MHNDLFVVERQRANAHRKAPVVNNHRSVQMERPPTQSPYNRAYSRPDTYNRQPDTWRAAAGGPTRGPPPLHASPPRLESSSFPRLRAEQQHASWRAGSCSSASASSLDGLPGMLREHLEEGVAYTLMSVATGKMLSVHEDGSKAGTHAVAQAAQTVSSRWRLMPLPASSELLAERQREAVDALHACTAAGPIEFHHGSWDVSAYSTNAHVLDCLAALLRQRPWLQLCITGSQWAPTTYARLDSVDQCTGRTFLESFPGTRSSLHAA